MHVNIGLPLSVRGGAHDWVGRALRHDGLVVDLSQMRQVIVDPHSRVATVAGGAKVKDMAAAADAHGLVAALGNCGEVGVAGLTLGGGYGPLNGTCRLGGGQPAWRRNRARGRAPRDNRSRQEPELFWALRGGGGNFGVVTSLRVRLHPARDMLAGSIVYHWSEAEPVLRRYAAFAATVPDELCVFVT